MQSPHPPSAIDQHVWHDDLCRIALHAGAAIMRVYQRLKTGDTPGERVRVERKADDSPLTEADQAAHQIIAAGLADLGTGIDVVSEEDAASHVLRSVARPFWLVDPLDGTKEFLAGTDEFTVNIALVRDGRAVLGVVYAPALGQLYLGEKGVGAFRLQASVRTAIRTQPALAPDGVIRVLASKSHMNPATRQFIDRLGPHRLLQAGSSLKFCRIAEGEADVYPRLGPTCEWDTAAAQAVVEAAGGHVVCIDGSPLTYGKPSVLNPDFIVSGLPLDRLPGQGGPLQVLSR